MSENQNQWIFKQLKAENAMLEVENQELKKQIEQLLAEKVEAVREGGYSRKVVVTKTVTPDPKVKISPAKPAWTEHTRSPEKNGSEDEFAAYQWSMTTGGQAF